MLEIVCYGFVLWGVAFGVIALIYAIYIKDYEVLKKIGEYCLAFLVIFLIAVLAKYSPVLTSIIIVNSLLFAGYCIGKNHN